MTIENFSDVIMDFTVVGLNIFSSLLIKDLPEEILKNFEEQNIIYASDDFICLVGHGGNDLWNHLPHPLNEKENPIDQFSIEQVHKFAQKYLKSECRIIFPHQQINVPLQRIARAMNISRKSLLGLDINDTYGLWFALRCAFITKYVPTIKNQDFISPCILCIDKPCIKACPANSIRDLAEFNINSCATYRKSTNSVCGKTCKSRNICPYKDEHQYEIDQMNYHMNQADLI